MQFPLAATGADRAEWKLNPRKSGQNQFDLCISIFQMIKFYFRFDVFSIIVVKVTYPHYILSTSLVLTRDRSQPCGHARRQLTATRWQQRGALCSDQRSSLLKQNFVFRVELLKPGRKVFYFPSMWCWPLTSSQTRKHVAWRSLFLVLVWTDLSCFASEQEVLKVLSIRMVWMRSFSRADWKTLWHFKHFTNLFLFAFFVPKYRRESCAVVELGRTDIPT